MSVEENMLILEQALEKAWSLPLSSGKCVVDAELIRDAITAMREELPIELRQAKAIVADRNEIVATAKKEAEAIMRAAEERAAHLTSHDEISRRAQFEANELMKQAETRVREVRANVNGFVDAALRQAEDALAGSINEINQALGDIKKARQGKK